MKDARCDARVSPRHGGGKCSNAATQTYRTGDITLHLCIEHLRVLKNRGHLGDEVGYIRRWLSVDPAD